MAWGLASLCLAFRGERTGIGSLDRPTPELCILVLTTLAVDVLPCEISRSHLHAWWAPFIIESALHTHAIFQVLSLYTILFLSSAMLLLDAFIAVKQLRNHFHASRPAFNAVHLLPSAAFATLVVIQLVVAVVLSGCLYHGDSWRWLVFFVLGPIPLFMIASSTGTQVRWHVGILVGSRHLPSITHPHVKHRVSQHALRL